MVLWYFHTRYAAMNEDNGCYLPSFYHNCARSLGGRNQSERTIDGAGAGFFEDSSEDDDIEDEDEEEESEEGEIDDYQSGDSQIWE